MFFFLENFHLIFRYNAIWVTLLLLLVIGGISLKNNTNYKVGFNPVLNVNVKLKLHVGGFDYF